MLLWMSFLNTLYANSSESKILGMVTVSCGCVILPQCKKSLKISKGIEGQTTQWPKEKEQCLPLLY